MYVYEDFLTTERHNYELEMSLGRSRGLFKSIIYHLISKYDPEDASSETKLANGIIVYDTEMGNSGIIR
jgi:hypothetical protein